MTRAQAMVVWLGVAASAALAIYPPWLRTVALTHAGTVTTSAGRATAWARPSPANSFAREESALAAKPDAAPTPTEPDPWAEFRVSQPGTATQIQSQNSQPFDYSGFRKVPSLDPGSNQLEGRRFLAPAVDPGSLGLASAPEVPTPPELRSWLGFQIITRSEVLGARLIGVHVDVARLVVEIVVVAMVTGALVLTFRPRIRPAYQ